MTGRHGLGQNCDGRICFGTEIFFLGGTELLNLGLFKVEDSKRSA